MSESLPLRRFVAFFFANALLQTVGYAWTAAAFLQSRHRFVDGATRWALVADALAGYGAIALLLAWVFALLARRFGARWPLVIAVLFCAIIDGLLFIDHRLFLLVGLHLHSQAVREALLVAEFEQDSHFGRAGLVLAVAAVAIALLALLALVSNRVTRRLGPRAARRLFAAIAAALVVAGAMALVASPEIGAFEPSVPNIATLLPWHARAGGRSVHLPSRADAYPPPVAMPALRRKPDVLFIVIESLRADAFTESSMPELTGFARAHGCLRATRHYSSSHATELGMFSLLYGLDAYYYRPMASGTKPSFPLEVFRANGYRIAGASASMLHNWGQTAFMTRQFTPYQEFPEPRNDARDRRLVEWARRFHATLRDRPSFLLLFFASTHVDYAFPPEFARKQPVLEDDWVRQLAITDYRRLATPIRNRYDNAVSYVDSVIGQLLAERAGELDRGELAVVVTADHGEAFWEHGTWGHVGLPFDDYSSQVPMFMCLPGASPPAQPVSGHTDVMPTLISALGPEPPLDPSSYSDGRSLLEAASDPCALESPVGFPSENRWLLAISRERRSWLELDAQSRRPVLRRTTDLDNHPATGAPDCVDGAVKRFGRFVKM